MAEPIVETRIAWPGAARCAGMLSFDFDARTLWIDPEDSEVEEAEFREIHARAVQEGKSP
ncbi:MAG: hypothetical protein OXQ84_03095 [bacterium]|nr:hypothetical protein [bacterium]